MNASSFRDYASSGSLNPDQIYTVELLIERVRSKFDPDYWDDWSERIDAREEPNYKPSFSPDHIEPAQIELMTLSWCSFQRVRDDERPVRDLTALRYLPKLSGLVLIDNEVTDIGPLRDCQALRELYLGKNPIRDISPLARCVDIEKLELWETPIEDLTVLESLPKLQTLSISADQIPTFKRLKSLPALVELEIRCVEPFDSFDGFPHLPELRVIRDAEVKDLRGLQQFRMLENLVNLSGEFESLEPLRELKRLTHANILRSRVSSVESLSELHELRDLWLNTEAQELDLAPLTTLPALHSVTIKCAGEDVPALAEFRSKLSSWDVEFRSAKARHTPSLELEIVDQETFDYYDTKKEFGLTDSDTNKALLSSELAWLDRQLEQVFAVDFTKDEDYTIPFRWGGARSRTLVLVSQSAMDAFPHLVLGIQKVLCHAHKDWIIYLQGEDEEFFVWVYPQKIMVTEEYAAAVRKLIYQTWFRSARRMIRELLCIAARYLEKIRR